MIIRMKKKRGKNENYNLYLTNVHIDKSGFIVPAVLSVRL